MLTMNASKPLEVLGFNNVSRRMVLIFCSVCPRSPEHLICQVTAYSEHRLAAFVASRRSVLWYGWRDRVLDHEPFREHGYELHLS